jgi:carboxyl-terminal processing protease
MHRLFVTIICLTVSLSGTAQDFSKAMHNSFLITRMVEKFHLQPKPLNDELSSHLFFSFLKALDENKILLLEEDFVQLSKYRYKLDDAIINKQTDFLRNAGIFTVAGKNIAKAGRSQ